MKDFRKKIHVWSKVLDATNTGSSIETMELGSNMKPRTVWWAWKRKMFPAENNKCEHHPKE